MNAVYDILVNNSASVGFFNTIGLPRLAPYWPRVFASAAIFELIFRLGQAVTPVVFPSTWNRLNKIERYKWCVRLASIAHACYMVTNSLVIIANSKLRSNPLYGYDAVAESAYSITVGYFLWDIIDTYKNIQIAGLGFMAHAIMSFGVYLLSFTPFLQYYGACFMMFEVSTIFLNVHLFLEDLGLQDAILYFINGMALVSSFFFARIVYGTILSINVWRGIANSEIPINPLITGFIKLANLTLMGLSYYWFSVIIMTAKRNALDADLIRALDEMDGPKKAD
ncbi:hypothetical protein LPJ57_007669 [Coemansia sp. RSA 486]|nr:hypothetical protein LPJ57_007669 [Coemansia sp. RSA 486]KAJ2236273.1 hypothetical protein IWW45_001928 [Coemansia sp. RSA 485]KAJ2634656.1 hypothetical protein GGF40_004075 [Coemansia sp. RSA 1286]